MKNLLKTARKQREEHNREIEKLGVDLANDKLEKIKAQVVGYLIQNGCTEVCFFAVQRGDEVTLMVTNDAMDAAYGGGIFSHELMKLEVEKAVSDRVMSGFNAYLKRKLRIAFPFAPFYYNGRTGKTEEASAT